MIKAKDKKDRDSTFNEPLFRSPFYEFFAAQETEGNWYNWNGYKSPTILSDEELEYFSIRSTCSVFDISPLNKYKIVGPQAEEFLNKLTVRNVTKQKVATVKYTLWCDQEGFVIDDGTLFRISDNEFRLCSQEKHLPWLIDTSHGFDVEIIDETKNICGVSLQGPTSASILRLLGVKGIDNLKPFHILQTKLSNIPIMISRTGFTGDLGYEIFMKNNAANKVIERVWNAGTDFGLTAIGYNALNMARIEAGFIVANIDFISSDHAIRPNRCRRPEDLGLGWLVDLNKGFFNGKKAIVNSKKENGTASKIYALEIDGKEPVEGSIIYYNKKEEVGTVTSAIWSPMAKKSIALAQLELGSTNPIMDNLWVEIYALKELQYYKLMKKATVVKPPFINLARRSACPPVNY
ncbi:MAG: aminomethyltransferase family protein [Paracoccaceae bacterium]